MREDQRGGVYGSHERGRGVIGERGAMGEGVYARGAMREGVYARGAMRVIETMRERGYARGSEMSHGSRRGRVSEAMT
jgi:hypothetical protein